MSFAEPSGGRRCLSLAGAVVARTSRAGPRPAAGKPITTEPPMTVPTAFARGFALLVQSYHYTQELDCSPWDFAVELPCLREVGLTNSDVRWLLSKRYVVQALE